MSPGFARLGHPSWAEVIAAIVAAVLVGAYACDADEDVSPVVLTENWDIVLKGRPFSASPGSIFPQEVFDYRAAESAKWLSAVSNVPNVDKTAAMKALTALPHEEYKKAARLEYNVLTAFASALSPEEHIRLAKTESDRSQSYFDARVRDALEWTMRFQALNSDDRIHTWDAALALSEKDLKAEIRLRYEQLCP